MRLFSSLTHINFALLWSGQTVSRLGDQLNRIALAWWVLEKTGSATAMGTVLIFSSVPMLLLLLVGGVAVDRFHRPRVMFLSDVLRGLVVGVVAVLAFTNALSLEHLFALSLVFGLVAAFFQPAYVAIVPEVTPPDVLPSANSLTTLSAEFSGIVGPALGAALVGLGGTAFAFALDSISFFISAVLLLPLLRLPRVTNPTGPAQSVLRDLGEGFKTLVSSPYLWVTTLLAALANFTISGPIQVALPFLVQDNLNAGVDALGLIYSMSAVGAVAAAIWVGRLTRLRRRAAFCGPRPDAAAAGGSAAGSRLWGSANHTEPELD